MTLIHDFRKRLSEAERDSAHKTLSLSNDAATVSKRIIELADRFVSWHQSQPLPERWEPLQLGRLSALLGVSREMMAAALTHAGWVERKMGTTSYWHRNRLMKQL